MNTELKIVMQNEVGTAIGNDTKSLCLVWKNEDEQNNELANLIIDAGNTIQSCGLLPSQLLKQRDEMREMLKLLFDKLPYAKYQVEKNKIKNILESTKL
ncbi:hypothetical protein [Epilithonimonas xixisoli]|uniref:Uncharacterized protein n=1 Tax=Epilithonimonas xixisoli TaxID=1476462 RepID=A0A4V3H2G0_9FLAO|nr:hypothetical protein [Epilithonimonas xixisoli]TDX83976.1 hypothetical protein B0I22_1564 [Epilithonimonas xixisoli]